MRTELKPPFVFYGDNDIADADGHVCTAENSAIANILLRILNAAYAPTGMTAEQLLVIIEVAALRTRDDGKHTGENATIRAFDHFAEQLRRLRKDHEGN